MSALLQNLPASIVVLPLVAALLISIFGRSRPGRIGKAWALTALTTSVLFALTLWLTSRVLGADVVYWFGNWTPVELEGAPGPVPVGIEYTIDKLNALVLCIVAGIAAVVTPFARLTVAREVPEDRHHLFYAVYLLCITGLLGITITGDAFNIYVLLEISSLTSYVLVALGRSRDRRALTASYHYLIMGTVGASFLLVGIGYLFMVTGTLNMADMHARLAELPPSRTVTTAFALILVGLTLKMALFPLHAWLPNAYTYAPSAVTALLASTATKVGVYVAVRFFFTVFGPGFELAALASDSLLLFACWGIIHGSLMAIQQRNVKRLLAYSSVAQIGYMVLGLGIANQDALTGSLLHLLNHALVKGALFLGVGAVIYRTNSMHLDALQGLGRRMPCTAAAITVGCLGLVGLPFTGGFISKWYLVSGALQAGMWPVAVCVLIGSVLAIVYALRILEPIYFGSPDAGPQVSEAPPSIFLPACALALGSVYCGVQTGAFSQLARGAASALLGAGS